MTATVESHNQLTLVHGIGPVDAVVAPFLAGRGPQRPTGFTASGYRQSSTRWR